MCNTKLTTKGIICTVVGVVLSAVFAAVGWAVYPSVVDHLITTEGVLVEGKLPWTLWQKPRYPIRIKHHIFECTNPEEVLQGARPIVVQRGPYIFDEFRDKNVYEKETGKVVYRETRTYFFNESASGENKLEDYIVTVNPIYMTVAKLLSVVDLPNWILNLADNYLKNNNESAFMNHTVEDVLYQGWTLEPYIELINKISDLSGIDLGPLPVDIRLGLFSRNNNSNDGEFVVNTGELDSNRLGNIELWNNQTYLDFWEGGDSYCNQIAGTDGTVFPAKLDTSKRLYIYQTDLCRTVYGQFVGESEYLNIPSYKYEVVEKNLASPADDPDNWCFCKDNSSCYDSGILNLGACYEGAPLLGSNAHLLGAAQHYFDGIEGINPQREKHVTYLHVERLTSVLLTAVKRVQLNIDFDKYTLKSLQNVNKVIFPMLWFEETAEADSETLELMHTYLVVVTQAVEISRVVLLAAAVVVSVVGIVLIIKGTSKKKRRVV